MLDKPFIIAEAGKNFIQSEDERSVQEYLANAKVLVDKAVENGADAIKWQTHHVEDEQLNKEIESPHFKGGDRYKWVQRNEQVTPLNEFWKPLKQYCDDSGIIFMTTPMSRGAAQRVEDLDVPLWKVGSGDILDFVLLDYLRNTQKPIIISSGMSTLDEVKMAVDFVKEKNHKVFALHCVSQYPCPPEDLRMGTIRTLKEALGVPVGFSDHSIGIEPDLVACALGVTLVEKHFSLSRDLWGPDHKVSMTPYELKQLRNGLDEVFSNDQKKQEVLNSEYGIKAVSQSEKILQDREKIFRPLFRKALVAGQDINEGEIIQSQMVYALRPQAHIDGLNSERYPYVVGKRLKSGLKKFDPITEDNLM